MSRKRKVLTIVSKEDAYQTCHPDLEKVFVLISRGGNSRSEFWSYFFLIDGLQEEEMMIKLLKHLCLD
jgi:hypothetical protein